MSWELGFRFLVKRLKIFFGGLLTVKTNPIIIWKFYYFDFAFSREKIPFGFYRPLKRQCINTRLYLERSLPLKINPLIPVFWQDLPECEPPDQYQTRDSKIDEFVGLAESPL